MEDLITCPYNASHQIRPQRIQYHLVKCRKSHPHVELEICSFNASHHVPKSELNEHLLKCPERGFAELQKYRFNDPLPGQHGMLALPRFFGSSLLPMGESPSLSQQSPPPTQRRTRVLEKFEEGSLLEDKEVERFMRTKVEHKVLRRPMAQKEPSPQHSLITENLVSPPMSPSSNSGFVSIHNSDKEDEEEEEVEDSPAMKTSPYPVRRQMSPFKYQPRTSSVKDGSFTGRHSPDLSVSDLSISVINSPLTSNVTGIGRGRGKRPLAEKAVLNNEKSLGRGLRKINL